MIKQQLNNSPKTPFLGAGMSFRLPYYQETLKNQTKIDCLEILAEHFLENGTGNKTILKGISQNFPIIPHAVGLSLGSAEGINPKYAAKLARLIEKVNAPWWSEHISFTQAAGIDIGHLSPLPRNETSIQILAENIFQVQKIIPQLLILENITYQIELPGSTMDEPDFLNNLLKETNCGLLLDVTNLYTNSVNFNFDPLKYLEKLETDKIIQLHIAGGYFNTHGLLIDSHSEPVAPSVWELLQVVLNYSQPKAIILERDANLPNFSEILSEIQKAKTLMNQNT